jgi:hypothetical protein
VCGGTTRIAAAQKASVAGPGAVRVTTPRGSVNENVAGLVDLDREHVLIADRRCNAGIGGSPHDRRGVSELADSSVCQDGDAVG